MPQTVTPPPSAAPAQPRAEQVLIDQQIARTRRGLKTVDLTSGLLTLVIGVLLYLLAAALVDQWVVPGGLGTVGRFLMFAGLLGGVGWYSWRTFAPLLFRSVNPIYAAQTIEANSPSLKNSLLSLLLFRGKRQPMSARVYQAIEQQTAQRLSESPLAGLVDRSSVLKLGYVLVGVVAICALYQMLSPKNPTDSFGRVLAPWAEIAAPSRVQISDILPGAASVARGERLTISAEVFGNREDEPVELHYSSVDQQIVDQRVLMTRNADGLRFSAELPPRRRGMAAARDNSGGINQDLRYWITAGDARSLEHLITVYQRPTIVVTGVRYEYPAYTGFPSQEVLDTGDIRAVEGTEVIISALANQPIKTAEVDFAADGRNDLSMQIDGDRATARFTLRLREDRRTPEHASYALRLTTTEGRQNRDPAKYRIEVTPDYAPEVRVVKPAKPEIEVRLDEKVRIDVEARDPDFALGKVEIKGQSGKRKIALGNLFDAIKLKKNDLAINGKGKFTGSLTVTPEELELKAGDVLEYWAKAEDNRRPEPNTGLSEHRRLKVVGPAERPQIPNAQNNNQQQNQNQQGKGDQQEQGEGGEGEAGGEGQASGGGGKGEPGAENQQGGAGEAGEQSEGEGEGSAGKGGENSTAQPNGGDENQGQGGGGGGGEQNDSNQMQQPSEGQNQAGENQEGQNQEGQNQQEKQQQGGQQQGESSEQQQSQSDGAESPDGRGATGKPQKLSAEGDDDAQAFDRINEHLNEQDAGNRGQQNSQPQNQTPESKLENQAQGNSPQNGQGQRGEQQTGEKQQDAQPSSEKNSSEKNNAEKNSAAKNNGENNNGGSEQTSHAEQNDAEAQAGQPPAGQQQQPGAKDENQAQASAGEDAAAEQPDAEKQPGESGEQGEMNAEQEPQPGERGAAGEEQAQQQDRGGEETNAGNAGEPKSARGEGGNQPDAGQPRPDQEREDKPQQGEDPKGPDSAPNRNQGESGGGENPGENQGSPQVDPKKPHEKQDSGKKQVADSEPSPQTNEKAKSESDAESSQSGDRSGEGQEGPGQQSKDEGKGGAGESTAAEEGGGAAEEQGEGETGKTAGNQQQADQPTGKSGEQQGNGSKQSSNAGEQAGGEQAGQPQGEQEQPQQAKAPEGEQPQQQPPGEQRGQAGKEPSQAGKSPQGAQGGKGGAAQQPSQGGTVGGESSGPIQEGEIQAGDKANLEYAKKQTDLVLDKLENQLNERKVDPELLDKLGWKQSDLQKFVDRWRNLEKRAASDAPEAKTELNEALRSLGLGEGGPKRYRSTIDKDKLRDLNEAYRGKTPLKYRDRVRAYVKGAAGDE